MFVASLRFAPVILLLALPSAQTGAPAAPPRARTEATLELTGLSGQHRVVSAADLAKLPHVDADVAAHNVKGKYRGVLLGDVLRLVDRPAGDALRGKALSTAIAVEASDGYRVVFAITEVDSAYSNKVVFLADARNGASLDSTEGPFRIIVPDEKRPARWAKKVTRIRLVPVN